jgi:hypothetical protein
MTRRQTPTPRQPQSIAAPLDALPQWLQHFCDNLRNSRADEVARQIAARLPLPPHERRQVQDYREAVTQSLVNSTPNASNAAALEAATIVVKIASVYGPREKSEADDMAWGEAFRDAIDDVPVWAIREAFRRWNCGDAGLDSDGSPFLYRLGPRPPQLRKIAREIVAMEKWRASIAERLINGKATDQHS